MLLVAFLSLVFGCQDAPAETTNAKDILLGAKQRYDAIHSYRCKASNVVMKYGLIKDTRYINTVLYSFEKPDKIRMTWLEPFLLKGQVAVFRDNELKVKLRFVPFAVGMDPNGFLAQDPAGNRIYDTQLGKLIDRLLEAITPGTVVSSGKDASQVAIKNDQGKVLAAIDKDLGLPKSIEFFGPDGRLSQACYFEDIALNVQFGPGEFDLTTSSEAQAADARN